MFNPIVETLIGLVFIYLLLSMVSSAVQELIAALLAWRPRTLRQGISNILCGDRTLVDEIYAHPLVNGLSRRSWWDKLTRRSANPSYISARTFSSALLDAAGMKADGRPVASTNTANGTPLAANTKTLLNSFVAQSSDMNALRMNIESWYDDAMDRVSGWYKRKTQLSILMLAAIIVAVSNADTFMLAEAFWNDPTLRAAAVAAASDWIKTHEVQTSKANKQEIGDLYPSTTSPETAPVPPTEEEVLRAAGSLSDTVSQVQTQLGRIDVPLGWFCESCINHEETTTQKGSSSAGQAKKQSSASKNSCNEQRNVVEANSKCVRGQLPVGAGWLVKIFGLLLTTLAIGQGAPFWFDLLQKLVNLRLAGDAPNEKKK